MKNRLTTLDIAYLIEDIRRKLVGLRVDQIYDIDKKTYLIRFAKSGAKVVLLLESGTRFHTTSFEWPKNPAPSGFAMKLRKHLNNKRLEKITQVGADRIVDMQFGMDTFAFHVILELYDKGNILLTDNSYKILNLLRPRIAGEERLAAHETYAVETAKQTFALEQSEIVEILKSGVTNKTLRELFMSKVEFGPALFAHVLKAQQLTPQTKIPSFDSDDALIEYADKIHKSFEAGCEILMDKSNVEGFILCATAEESKRKGQGASAGESKDAASSDAPSFYDQFHPAVLVEDYDQEKVVRFDSFDIAVDEFFSKVESQKIDMKQLNQEKDAIRKLEKVKLDQQKRLDELKMGQEVDRRKAELITTNLAVVEMAINAIRKLVANQIPWETIDEQIKEAKATGDPLASLISELNLKQNSITILLKDPYEEDEEPVKVSLDLNLSAYANATKYYDLKKASAKKEERTLVSQEKALKSTEKKTMASIKEAQTIHSIKKARKVLWFEKFRWFITSENYLVLGGRDAQQNELLVKKYMRPRDIYLHADAHGAPSIIIKNDNPEDQVPPKTLNESGGFGVCCSGSWDSKVVSSCWWVWGDQVSKSAPSGEYLPSGSFMIRGKKNYLPPCQLVLGFGFLFRLTEDCIEAHKNERVRRHLNSESESLASMSIHEEEEELEMPDEEFPDTHVEVDIASAPKGSERYKRLMGLGEGAEGTNEEFMVTSTPSAAPSLQKLKNKQKKAVKTEKALGKGKQEAPKLPKLESIDDNQKSNKRGHHGRKKKLKEKYKDQDEEERLLKMQLLRTGAIAVAEGSESRNDSEDAHSDSENETGGGESGRNRKPSENQQDKTVPEQNSVGAAGGDEEIVEVEEEPTAESEIDLLKTLTGSPLEQDELLYAIPVIAPYSTLQNYKFRIKMTPGTAKRGKAAKTALESFLRDKEATPREKDLIKAVKDQDLARNFPGKVKLSNVIRDKK